MMMSQLSNFQILHSFALWSDKVYNLDIVKNKRVDLFLDSGAFTNYKQKKEIVTLDDYIHFVKENKKLVWRYMNLDVVGDAEKSEHNFEAMKSAGLNPVPVFTRSNLSPKERARSLLELCSKNEFIAIGGVAGRLQRKEDLKYLYDTCFFIKKYTKTKFHILGCGSPAVVEDIRPYSMDSSASSTYNAYGQIAIWDYRNKKIITLRRTITKEKAVKYKDALRKYGINSKYLLGESFWSKENLLQRAFVNLYTYFLFQKFLNKHNVKYFQALPLSYFQKFDQMVKHYAL